MQTAAGSLDIDSPNYDPNLALAVARAKSSDQKRLSDDPVLRIERKIDDVGEMRSTIEQELMLARIPAEETREHIRNGYRTREVTHRWRTTNLLGKVTVPALRFLTQKIVEGHIDQLRASQNNGAWRLAAFDVDVRIETTKRKQIGKKATLESAMRADAEDRLVHRDMRAIQVFRIDEKFCVITMLFIDTRGREDIAYKDGRPATEEALPESIARWFAQTNQQMRALGEAAGQSEPSEDAAALRDALEQQQQAMAAQQEEMAKLRALVASMVDDDDAADAQLRKAVGAEEPEDEEPEEKPAPKKRRSRRTTKKSTLPPTAVASDS